MTEHEKLEAGLEYSMSVPEMREEKLLARERCARLNAAEPRDAEGREALIRELLGSAGRGPQIMENFHCDCGKNITVGDNFFANYNVTIIDRAKVTVGNRVLMAPGVLVATVNHSMDPARRREYCVARPITIGDDVWLGGNCTVLPGVTIGNNVIVAAGAVVNQDVPDNTLVAGVPAVPVKSLAPRSDTETK